MEFDNAIRFNQNVHDTRYYWDLDRQQRNIYLSALSGDLDEPYNWANYFQELDGWSNGFQESLLAGNENKKSGSKGTSFKKENASSTIPSEDDDDSISGDNVVAATLGSDDDWADVATDVSISENWEPSSDDPVEEQVFVNTGDLDYWEVNAEYPEVDTGD